MMSTCLHHTLRNRHSGRIQFRVVLFYIECLNPGTQKVPVRKGIVASVVENCMGRDQDATTAARDWHWHDWRFRLIWICQKSTLSIQFPQFSRRRNVHIITLQYRPKRIVTIARCILMSQVLNSELYLFCNIQLTIWRYYKMKRVVCKMLPYKRKVTQNRQLNLEFKTVKTFVYAGVCVCVRVWENVNRFLETTISYMQH